jgi:hypothetical protein
MKCMKMFFFFLLQYTFYYNLNKKGIKQEWSTYGTRAFCGIFDVIKWQASIRLNDIYYMLLYIL